MSQQVTAESFQSLVPTSAEMGVVQTQLGLLLCFGCAVQSREALAEST